jgi:hypothetical protein
MLKAGPVVEPRAARTPTAERLFGDSSGAQGCLARAMRPRLRVRARWEGSIRRAAALFQGTRNRVLEPGKDPPRPECCGACETHRASPARRSSSGRTRNANQTRHGHSWRAPPIVALKSKRLNFAPAPGAPPRSRRLRQLGETIFFSAAKVPLWTSPSCASCHGIQAQAASALPGLAILEQRPGRGTCRGRRVAGLSASLRAPSVTIASTASPTAIGSMRLPLFELRFGHCSS